MMEGVTPAFNPERSLEALILQDEDFKRLELSLKPFNIFEAL